MMMDAADNYFLRYHQLVLNRILSGQTQLYRHQQEALLAIYQKAARGEMDGSYRQAALILAGVGTGKTLIQAIAPGLPLGALPVGPDRLKCLGTTTPGGHYFDRGKAA